jgi:hypothetical protein
MFLGRWPPQDTWPFCGDEIFAGVGSDARSVRETNIFVLFTYRKVAYVKFTDGMKSDLQQEFRKYLDKEYKCSPKMSGHDVVRFWKTEIFGNDLRDVVVSLLNIPIGNSICERGFSELKEEL